MEFGVWEILIGIVILFWSLYYYLTRNLDYWNEWGIAGPKPIPFFGNYKDVILGKTNEAIILKNIYDVHKNKPLTGVFVRNTPRLVIQDPDLIKDVLIKDFSVFPDRGFHIYKKPNPFNANLLNLEYKRWKPLRSSLTPMFTSGKLKEMFYLITDCANNFQKYTERLVEKNEPIECLELTAKFATDAFGACAFGLNMNAINDEHSEFRKFGISLFEVSLRNQLKRSLRLYFPTAYDLIGHLLEPKSGNQFFLNSVKETLKRRKESNVRRNDFIDLLLDLKDSPVKSMDLEITDDLLVAQAFVLFGGGFDTSSTAISNAVYELALDPSIQDKLRNEILEVLAKTDGNLTYDCIKNMTYLDKVIKETLRKYPPPAGLNRMSVSPYTFKGTNVTIPKNVRVMIPIWAIHRDPDIYPDPETFDPERFSEENEGIRHPMNYLSFGDGPHKCIAMRFAYYQVKVGVVAIVEKFRISACDKTFTNYQLEPTSSVAKPSGGLYLKLSKV